MLEQKTVIDQIEIKPDGTVQGRAAKQVLKDGQVLRQEPHRFALEPGGNFQTLVDNVNAHLTQMGEATIAPEEWARVERVVKLEHTPDVVKAHVEKTQAAFAAKKAAEQAETELQDTQRAAALAKIAAAKVKA